MCKELSTLNLPFFLTMRWLLSKVTSNLFTHFMVTSLVFCLTLWSHLTQLGDLSQCWFLLTDWSFLGWSAPGLCLTPFIYSLFLGIWSSPNTIYMLMIPKSIFSASTNPGSFGFMCLTGHLLDISSWIYNRHLKRNLFKAVFDLDNLGPHLPGFSFSVVPYFPTRYH